MRADRLLSMLLLLQRHSRMTATALAEKLEVSRRTILRDVDALSAAGIPIYADKGHGGGIALDTQYRLSLVGLSEAEALTLFLSANATLLADLGLHGAAESVVPKLFAVLPALHQQSVQHLRARVFLDSSWWSTNDTPPFFGELLRAVNESRRVRAVYRHRDGSSNERELEPYSLVAKSSVWYMLAAREGELRAYRVARFQSVELLAATFERRADFDPERFWREHVQAWFETLAPYHFELSVDPRSLDVVRAYSMGHYRIGATPEVDGWYRVAFEMEAVEPAAMLVFALGSGARIIQPQALRDAVLERSRAVLAAASSADACSDGIEPPGTSASSTGRMRQEG